MPEARSRQGGHTRLEQTDGRRAMEPHHWYLAKFMGAVGGIKKRATKIRTGWKNGRTGGSTDSEREDEYVVPILLTQRQLLRQRTTIMIIGGRRGCQQPSNTRER